MNDKELVWLPKDIVKQLKDLESTEEIEASVKKIIEKKKLDLEQENEMLNESLLSFKSVCLAHKNALKKVYEEQNELIYKMWEEMGDVGSEISRHVSKMTELVSPLRNEINGLARDIKSINDELRSARLYIPEELARVASSVERMDDRTKKLLIDLLRLSTQDKAVMP